MSAGEWPEETVGLEKCGDRVFRYKHGIYHGILVHDWNGGWCIMAADGGVDGLNVDYGVEDDHIDCSAEEHRKVSCLFGVPPPFAAIDAAWASPREDVVYKVMEIPR